MLIAIVILLLFVSSALVGAMYSNFTAFLVNFSDLAQYNKAYYSAISGLERAELVLRYRAPGYEGIGGRMGDNHYGSGEMDFQPSAFSFLSEVNGGGILREIASRTKKIPAEGQGNIDWMLASGNRLDFNRLDYADAENFTFMLDKGDRAPYISGTIEKNLVYSFTGIVQLPYLLKAGFAHFTGFGPLDVDNISLHDGKLGTLGINETDDPIVDWSFRRESTDGRSWQVMSVRSTGYGAYYDDSRLLESRINASNIMEFGSIGWGGCDSSPFCNRGALGSSASFTGIVEHSSDASLFEQSFSDLLNDWDNVLFRLSLINPLYSEKGQIFPYLEYQLSFFDDDGRPSEMADRFYSITTKGRNGNYEVQLFMQKPTIVESILRSFTVMFD